MNNIMLDLETMGIGSNAAIVAIGACAFDLPARRQSPNVDPRLFHQFYCRVSLASSMRAGMQVDASTILWWMQQSDAARKSTFEGAEIDLVGACFQFADFVSRVSLHLEGNVAIWGNGATFDNVVIRSAFKAVHVAEPWSFRNDKCYRTVINLLPEDRRPKLVRYGVWHNALDDAITQAVQLQKVWDILFPENELWTD